MAFKWRDSHMLPFLASYNQECLWNINSIDYKKVHMRDKAYCAMLLELGLPGLTIKDIKSKIKTVRTKYISELGRVRNSIRSGISIDEVYEPRLFWYKEADEFLQNVCKPQSSSSNLKDFDQDPCPTTSICQEECEEEEVSDQIEVVSETLNSPSYTPLPTQSARERKRQINTLPSIHDAITKLQKISANNTVSNEFDLFCESLAVQLKKMPLERALICQEKLQNVMTQERLQQIRSESTPMFENFSIVYTDSSD